MSGLTGQCAKCGHLIKEFMGRTIPHDCPVDRPRTMAADMGPRRVAPEPIRMAYPRRTPGDELRAALAARDAEVRARKDRQARALAEAGMLTLWRVPAGEGLTVWSWLKTVSYSPAGAMLGLGLLALCWLSGCA